MMARHLWEMTGDEPFCAYQLTGQGSRPGVDLLVRHPEPTYLRGRPDWLRRDRHSLQGRVEPPAACLVQLLPAAEGPASTPADQLLVDEDGQFELLVPTGDYLLRVWAAPGCRDEPRPVAVWGDLAGQRIHLGPGGAPVANHDSHARTRVYDERAWHVAIQPGALYSGYPGE